MKPRFERWFLAISRILRRCPKLGMKPGFERWFLPVSWILGRCPKLRMRARFQRSSGVAAHLICSREAPQALFIY
jgi:hypothetical protein